LSNPELASLRIYKPDIKEEINQLVGNEGVFGVLV